MKTIAVISEFNPFHNGHAYLINELKKSFPDAAVAAIMSGSWVQRGEPAIFSKQSRASAAVLCGADLVLELPAPWSMAGAEFFARAGVHIADCIGADILAFGSESGDIQSLKTTAQRLSSTEYAEALSRERALKTEMNTAKLRAGVFAALYGESAHFSASNDLLALEYIQAITALGAKITPITVKRIGSEFGAEEIDNSDSERLKFSSASAIRNAIKKGELDLTHLVPQEAEQIFKNELDAGNIHDISALDTAAAVFLCARDPSELSEIMEMSGGIENRICTAAMKYNSIAEIITAAKEKRYSESRLRRAVIGSLLGIKMSLLDELPHFTNVLAFSEKGRALLAANRKAERIAILSTKSACRRLSGIAAEQYAIYRRAERLYSLTLSNHE